MNTTTTPMPMMEAARLLNLANNGYTFASSMSAEFIRQAERLVARGSIVKRIVRGPFGTEPAYFTKRAAAI